MQHIFKIVLDSYLSSSLFFFHSFFHSFFLSFSLSSFLFFFLSFFLSSLLLPYPRFFFSDLQLFNMLLYQICGIPLSDLSLRSRPREIPLQHGQQSRHRQHYLALLLHYLFLFVHVEGTGEVAHRYRHKIFQGQSDI